MAVSFLLHEVSDLCIGKPALRELPISATAGEALLAIRRSGDTFISVWSADCLLPEKKRIAGKLCFVDILCFLCKEENIGRPAAALQKPVSDLLGKDSAELLRRIEPYSSIVEAVSMILEGAQILLVPIPPAPGEFCWLTQEDMIRFFFNSIAFFSPAASASVTQLGLVRSTDTILAIRHHDPALSAAPLIQRALREQTSVAVVTDDHKLIGEISPSTLAGCHIAAAAALCALSAGQFMAYIDSSSSPTTAGNRAVKSILRRKGMQGMVELMEEEEEEFRQPLLSCLSSASSSSDEEGGRRPRRSRSAGSYSAKMGRRSEDAIVCQRKSSLAGVMVQALAHRVGYVWVVEEDYTLVGVVIFRDILKLFQAQLQQNNLF